MFITLEGPEGSGKTRQISLLADALIQHGYSILVTREPGGTPVGDQIRSVLFDLKNTDMRPRTEILLFQASRAQLVEQVIRPSLASGDIVLCDRYADSTLAYQGYGHQVDMDELESIVLFATGGLRPDLTLLLDVDIEVGLRRKLDASECNRLDAYDLGFHRRVRHGYLEMAQAEPGRWVVIDAGQPPEAVQAAILKVVLGRLQVKV
jgi:dTMP kinase